MAVDDKARIAKLREVIENYVTGHDSWRCYTSRYPKCMCGLDATLHAAGIDPSPWRPPPGYRYGDPL